jgi:hypothetical protein
VRPKEGKEWGVEVKRKKENRRGRIWGNAKNMENMGGVGTLAGGGV